MYEHYSKCNLGRNNKPYNANWMTYMDCETLMHEDCVLKVSRYTVREAFALSKMTVINELTSEGDL